MSDSKGMARRSIKANKAAKVARNNAESLRAYTNKIGPAYESKTTSDQRKEKNAESMWGAANKVGPAYGESVASAAGRISKYRESVKGSTKQGSYARNYFKNNSK